MMWLICKSTSNQNTKPERYLNINLNVQQNGHKAACTVHLMTSLVDSMIPRSICVAERLALPTSDHGVTGSNPAGGEILPEPKRHFIAQSLSCSPFHRLEMTEILLKGRKTLTHPSINHTYKVAED